MSGTLDAPKFLTFKILLQCFHHVRAHLFASTARKSYISLAKPSSSPASTLLQWLDSTVSGIQINLRQGTEASDGRCDWTGSASLS